MEEDDFKYHIVFKSICYNLKGKLDLSENSKKYIDQAKELFQSVIKSLDSMLDNSEDSTYHFTPHLKEIIKYSWQKLPKTQEEIEKLKEKCFLVINNLDNLKKNPHEFYKTKDSKKILSLSDKLGPIYWRQLSPILS